MSEVAFIGLGTMGRGMVRNLSRAGYEVTAWNRTRRPLPAELESVTQVETIADAIRGKPVVFVCVTGPDAQRAVFDEALIVHLGPDVLVIDSTTTDPAVSARIAQAVAARGSRYLDAPVFGSKSEAWEGRLDFVCGGEETTFRDAEPVLCNLAATVHHIGPSGAGATMKLIGNLLVAAQLASLGEALALARRAGLDGEAVVGVFDVTDYSSGLIRGVSRASLRNDFSPSFYLAAHAQGRAADRGSGAPPRGAAAGDRGHRPALSGRGERRAGRPQRLGHSQTVVLHVRIGLFA